MQPESGSRLSAARWLSKVPCGVTFISQLTTVLPFFLCPQTRRPFAATIRSSSRPRAKWSRSYSASSATSTSSWRIIRKVSPLLLFQLHRRIIPTLPVSAQRHVYVFTPPLTNVSVMYRNFWERIVLDLWLTPCPSDLETSVLSETSLKFARAIGSIHLQRRLLALSCAKPHVCPLPLDYSIIGIPEVLQFTVRLLEGETQNKHTTHVTQSVIFSHPVKTHSQRACRVR